MGGLRGLRGRRDALAPSLISIRPHQAPARSGRIGPVAAVRGGRPVRGEVLT